MPPDRSNRRRNGIVGAAIVPHAPQFLTLPPTEDHAQVARVKATMHKIGDDLRRLEPDLIVVISNCHGEEMVIDCVPPFAIHRGDRAPGTGLHAGWWKVDGEAGHELVRKLYDEGFDPAFTMDKELGTAFTIGYEFCGFTREQPFLPVFVNSYVPPQPTPERCFAFGRALARSIERMGRRAVVIASGGLSHYPATPMYPTPDLTTDRHIFERISEGNLLHLMSFDETRLDKTGNVECRSLQILAGAIGDHKPDSAVFEPSWHHIYAVVGWTSGLEAPEYAPYYPGFTARHTQLARAIHAIAMNAAACEKFLTDRKGFGSSFDLSAEEAAALATMDEDVLRERYAINPMLVYQAKLKTGDKVKNFTKPA